MTMTAAMPTGTATPPAGREHTFAIVIPTLDEESELGDCLRLVARARTDETIVADGGSHDRTAEIARRHGVGVVSAARPRRSEQMNLGAAACSSDILVFLCADSRLPGGALDAVDAALTADPRLVAGSFALCLHDGSPGRSLEAGGPPASTLRLHLLAAAADLYCRCTRTLMCDRGIFVCRQPFDRLGGFRPLPVMEDVDLGRRLKRSGQVTVLGRPAVSSSGRRFRGPRGPLLALRVLLACMAFSRGASAETICRRLYEPRGGRSP